MQAAVTQTKDHAPSSRILEVIASLISPLGYEVVHFEVLTHRQKVLRLFIDHIRHDAGGIGVDDCARVSHVLDEPLDALPELNALFQGAAYELEVSSPGVDRPLRRIQDYDRFSGREIRVHTFRPLTAEEIGNADYLAKNPKQKNFVGKLLGLEEDRVRLDLSANDGAKPNRGKKKAAAPAAGAKEIRIPFALISKANIEPDFDLDGQEDQKTSKREEL